MIRILTLVAAAALALAAPAAAQNIDPAIPRLLVQAPEATAVAVTTVDIQRGDGTSFPVDIYAAPGSRPRPTLVFLSGTDDPRDWNVYKDYGRLAVARGFTALIPAKRYARASIEAFTNGRGDTMTLLKALPGLRAKGVDAGATCLWAFSGGGPMISAAYAADAVAVDCVIGFYPFLRTPVGDDAFRLTYSPVEAVRANAGPASPPLLLVRAGKDMPVLNQTIDAFTAAALEKNMPVTVLNLPDAVHAFDLFNDTPWSRAAIEQGFDFATEHAR